jgi:hypothetical protein
MKKMFLSLLLGSLITVGLYLHLFETPGKPSLSIIFVPIGLLVNAITEDDLSREIIFCSVLVVLNSFLSYLIVCFIAKVATMSRKTPNKAEKKNDV